MTASQNSKAALAAKLERIIYVEGQDDAFFIDALLTEIGADRGRVGIVHLNGTGAFEKEVDFLIKSAAYVQKRTTHLAFFLDADTAANSRIAAMNEELTKRGLPELQHALVKSYDGGQRAIGAFIFPDGVSNGELEDLFLQTVTLDDRLRIAESAIQEVEQKHGPLNKRTKRVARIYISTLPIKPCGVGRAYCEGVFDTNHPLVESVRDFLRYFTTIPII